MKVFKDIEEFNRTFRKYSSWLTEGIEYYVFDGYRKNRVLIVAPHAGMERIRIKVEGREYWVRVGDENTDKLAKIAAYNIKGCFLVSHIPRTEVDLARNPENIGKGVKLRVRISLKGNERRLVLVPIHKNTGYYSVAVKFHRFIHEIQPNFILSFHGMRYDKYDALLGFGINALYIEGMENAVRFKEIVLDELESEVRNNIKIKISERFLGKSEYILNSHVKYDTFGCLVEFSYRKRIFRSLPQKECQMLAVAIARAAVRFLSKSTRCGY
ncbi:hypothetical protein J7L13_01055 [bacterium]|nr:hypothetical protein [bacterium]